MTFEHQNITTVIDALSATLSLAYAFTLAWRFNKELVFFTKRFNHTTVVFFSGNNTIKTHQQTLYRYTNDIS